MVFRIDHDMKRIIEGLVQTSATGYAPNGTEGNKMRHGGEKGWI